jgi:hypothetical protein
MSLLLKIHQIHNCLNIICDVESDIFNGSIKGLFRKKDYAGNEGILEVAIVKLVEISESLENFDSGKRGINMVANDARDYAIALYMSTLQLKVIINSLAAKANGHSYSMSQYNEDMNQFKVLQDIYMSLGNKLNTHYKLYSYEIAQLDD